MSVGEVAEKTGISMGLLYDWARKDKVPVKTSPEGIKLLSLDAVRAHRKEVPVRRGKAKATKVTRAPRKMRPSTKQADHLARTAACVEVFYPEGIPVDQYLNALVLVRALDAVST